MENVCCPKCASLQAYRWRENRKWIFYRCAACSHTWDIEREPRAQLPSVTEYKLLCDR